MRLKRIIISSFLIFSFAAYCPQARADSSHEFLMSVTYGTLAGTLLGVASLAFSGNPGNHLQSVARGASLGLYAGILLGLYVVYAVPDENDDLNKILPPDDSQPQSLKHIPIVYPMVSDRGHIDGAAVSMNVWNF